MPPLVRVVPFAVMLVLCCCGSADQSARPVIELSRPLVLSGIGDSVDLVSRKVVTSSSGFVAAFRDLSPAMGVAVFAPDGHFVNSISRQGGGPGELRAIQSIGFGPGDSLWVVDAMFSAHLFTPPPYVRYVRTVRFAHAVTGGATRFGFISPAIVFGGAKKIGGLPPILTTLDGRTRKLFGKELTAQEAERRSGPVFAVDSAKLWSAMDDEYTLDLIDGEGRVLKRVSRTVDWFPPRLKTVGFPWQIRPRPQIVDVAQSAGGALFVLVRRAHRNWKPSSRGSSTAPSRPLTIGSALRFSGDTHLFEYVLEVFNAQTGEFIGTRDLEGTVLGFAAADVLCRASETQGGSLKLTLSKISIGSSQRISR